MQGVLTDRWLLAILGVHLLLAYLLFNPLPFTGGDNAHYMLLAESLTSGQGYRDIHVVSTPLHAKYPPAYPAVLAVVRLLGGGLIAFKLLSVAFTTASLVFLFLLAQQRLGTLSARVVTGLMAVNPLLLEYSHWVLSEAPFICLVLACLWALESEDDGGARSWLALLLAVLAFYTRMTGAVLLLAVIAFHAFGRRWIEVRRAALVTVLAVGAWAAWGARAVSAGGAGYGSDFLRLDPYRPELGDIGIMGLFARVLVNAWEYAAAVVPAALGSPGGFGIALSLIILVLALVSWRRGLRRAATIELFLLFYVALILVWPPVWADGRFLLPALPLIILLAADGYENTPWMQAKLEAAPGHFLIFVTLLVLFSGPILLERISLTGACRGEMRRGDELACYDPVWRAFAVSARWVDANTPHDVVIVNRKPRMFYLFADRKTAPFPLLATDMEKFEAFDRAGADYVVVSATIPASDRYVVPLILANPDRFERLFVTGEEPITAHVLRYVP